MKQMTFFDFIRSLKNHKNPTIEFTLLAEEYELDCSPKMRAKVITVMNPDSNSPTLVCDLNPFSEYNDSVDKNEFYNDKREAVLSWKESGFYPQDGVFRFPMDAFQNVCFKVINGNPLLEAFFKEDKDDKDITYIEWLENEVIRAKGIK